MTAALVMPYTGRVGAGISPPADATLTIEPRPAALITRPATATPQNTPLRFTAMTASRSSSVVSTIGALRMMPATFAHTSMRPDACNAAAASAVDRGAVRHVGRHDDAVLDVCGGLLEPAGVTVGQHDLGTRLGVHQRRGLADAGCGTGDDRGATFERERRRHVGIDRGVVRVAAASRSPEMRSISR